MVLDREAKYKDWNGDRDGKEIIIVPRLMKDFLEADKETRVFDTETSSVSMKLVGIVDYRAPQLNIPLRSRGEWQ